MNALELYEQVIPLFGMKPDETGQLCLIGVEDAPIELKLNGKKLYAPTPEVVDTATTKGLMVYHPALEDVTRKPSATVQYTAKCITNFWGLVVMQLLAKIVYAAGDEQAMEATTPTVRAHLLDEVHLPQMSNADLKHIEHWIYEIMEDTTQYPSDYLLSVKIRSPREGEAGLRVATIYSQVLKDVQAAVKDDLGSINGIKMSKKSIKHLEFVLKLLIPVNGCVVNEFTSCPSLEVLWRAAYEIYMQLHPYMGMLDVDTTLMDMSVKKAVLAKINQKQVLAAIATVTMSEGNRPMTSKRKTLDVNIGNTKEDTPPWDPAPPQAPVQQPPVPAPVQAPAASQYATLPPALQPQPQTGQFTGHPAWAPDPNQPTAQAPVPATNNEPYGKLPAWLQPQQQQYVTQGYQAAQLQFVPAQQAAPPGYVLNPQYAPMQQQYIPYTGNGYAGAR